MIQQPGQSPRAPAGIRDRPTLAASVWWEHLRTLTGIAASIAYGVAVNRALPLPLIGGLAFGGGWGLVLLYAVQLRGIVQKDGSASWSGVLAASLAYTLVVTVAAFGIKRIPAVLDLSTVPLGVIYIAAKLGCHRIGCCNWKHAHRSPFLSLPLLEVAFTTIALTLAITVSRLLQVPGTEFCVFSICHVGSWSIAKRFRADG